MRFPESFAGKRVLDIGAWDGFYSFEAERRGASDVLATDSYSWSGDGWGSKAGFDFAHAALQSNVRSLQIDVMELSPERIGGSFDVVLFLGVLYHLRHPLLALDLLHEHVTSDLLVFQSMLRGSPAVGSVADDYPFTETRVFERPEYPRLHFVEHKYAGDQTNWWIPNRACMEAMLRSAGFAIEAHPVPEVFVCRTVPIASAEQDPALHVELGPVRGMAGRAGGRLD